MELKGSRTEANLMSAFAGESMARNKYSYYASKARKEGFEQISNIFTETADNEKEHAKVFFKHLLSNGVEGEMINIIASYPVGWSADNTLKNLEYAANGENEEWSELYPLFADVAEEEGFSDIAHSWRMIAKVEREHEKRFRKLYDNVKNQKVFIRQEKVLWKCLNCGYVHEGTEAPKICPSCSHPQSYFELFKENY